MDNPGNFGPILATRTMTWRRADGVDFPATVEIGLPFEHPGPPENQEGPWCCRVRTQGLGNDQSYTLFGEDSVQALTIALVFAGTIVANSPIAHLLDWAIMPNWGFPVFPGAEGNGGGNAGGPGLEP